MRSENEKEGPVTGCEPSGGALSKPTRTILQPSAGGNAESAGFDPTISYTDHAKDAKTDGKQIRLSAAVEQIREGEHRDRVERIREELTRNGRSKRWKELKSQLPGFLFCGTFSYRNAENLVKHSGLICVDIDDLAADRVKSLRNAIQADTHTVVCFLSPSGNGLKIVIRVPPVGTGEDHKRRLYPAVERYFQDRFGVTIDPVCTDVCRLCFASHDPQVYYNPGAVEMTIPAEGSFTQSAQSLHKDVSVYSGLSGPSGHSVYLGDATLEEYAQMFACKKPHTSCRLLLELARGVKTLKEAGRNPTKAELEAAFDVWYKASLPNLNPSQCRMEYLHEFMEKIPIVRTTLHEGTLTAAVEAARESIVQNPPEPDEVWKYENPDVMLLIATCYHLQRKTGTKAFFLSNHSYARAVWGPDEISRPSQVSKWLRMLVRFEVLTMVEKGIPNVRATRYFFTSLVPDGATAAAAAASEQPA